MLQASQWIAHRGYQRRYPENSAIGISAALAAGAAWVEVDVQLTADLVPVLAHDIDTKRVSSVNCNILYSPWRELKQLTNGEPARFNDQFSHSRFSPLATLAALFEHYPNAQCLVEIKQQSLHRFGTERCLTQIMRALGSFIARCVLISFDSACLLHALTLGVQRVAPVLSSWQSRTAVLAQLPTAEMLICHYRSIDQVAIPNSPPVALYEVADIELARALCARGATLIETFAIGEMLAQTEQLAKR